MIYSIFFEGNPTEKKETIHIHDPSTGNVQVSAELWHDGDTEAFQVWKFVKVTLSEATAALKGGSSVEIMVSWEGC